MLVDDARIKQLTDEVLAQLAAPKDPVAADLESRVAALETAVRDLRAPQSPASRVVLLNVHPSVELLSIPGGEDRCVLEPDKPCVQSGRCRTFGH